MSDAPSNANTSGLGDVGLSETYRFAYESIRNGAPGLSDATCAAIARSINMKVSLSKTDRATAAEARNAEVSMLAHRWMEAHDRLKAGLDYNLPTPADLPNEKARADRLAKVISKACDLLAERTHGNSARSPAHNARLQLEEALQQETQP